MSRIFFKKDMGELKCNVQWEPYFSYKFLVIRQQWDYIANKRNSLYEAGWLHQTNCKICFSKRQYSFAWLLYQYVEYSQQNNRGKFASEILSIIKDTDRGNSLGKLREFRLNKEIESRAEEFIIQTVMSSFTMKDLVCTPNIQEELEYFIKVKKASWYSR